MAKQRRQFDQLARMPAQKSKSKESRSEFAETAKRVIFAGAQVGHCRLNRP